MGLLQRAATILARGGVVAFPTETFYGLGVAALEADAVRAVFAIKGRPESKPLLVLVDSIEMMETMVADVPAVARSLMARHWPGPLTLVLRAAPRVPAALTAGRGTIGVRLPSHPVARGLVHAVGAPLTAPSANPTGQPPPTTAAEVLRYFDGAIALVLDGGPTPGGPPSTVLDVTAEPPRVIRAGAVVVDR